MAEANGGASRGVRHAYLFTAKGIQRWVLEGGRLRDIGAVPSRISYHAAFVLCIEQLAEPSAGEQTALPTIGFCEPSIEGWQKGGI